MAARFILGNTPVRLGSFTLPMFVCCQLVDLEVAPPNHELFRLFRVFRGQS
jgi:hypothetical protein